MSKKTIPHLSALILLTLGEQNKSQSGYDLSKLIAPFWQPSHQQVYRDLGTLFKNEMVVFNDIPQKGRPDLKLYRLTEKGAFALEKYLEQAKSSPEEVPHRSQAMVMFAARRFDYFTWSLELARERLEHLIAKREGLEEPFDRVLLSRSIGLLEADIEFYEQVLDLQEHAA